eukprot:Rhum_TRINITY_DN16415_c0_g1::Rhum_TRINITY_DN16415_c0_g1_i1::g.163225::m.163225
MKGFSFYHFGISSRSNDGKGQGRSVRLLLAEERLHLVHHFRLSRRRVRALLLLHRGGRHARHRGHLRLRLLLHVRHVKCVTRLATRVPPRLRRGLLAHLVHLALQLRRHRLALHLGLHLRPLLHRRLLHLLLRVREIHGFADVQRSRLRLHRSKQTPGLLVVPGIRLCLCLLHGAQRCDAVRVRGDFDVALPVSGVLGHACDGQHGVLLLRHAGAADVRKADSAERLLTRRSGQQLQLNEYRARLLRVQVGVPHRHHAALDLRRRRLRHAQHLHAGCRRERDDDVRGHHREQPAQALREALRDLVLRLDEVVQTVSGLGDRAQHLVVVLLAEAEGGDRHAAVLGQLLVHRRHDRVRRGEADVRVAVGEEPHRLLRLHGALSLRCRAACKALQPREETAAQVRGAARADGLDETRRLLLLRGGHGGERHHRRHVVVVRDDAQLVLVRQLTHDELQRLEHERQLPVSHATGAVDNGAHLHRCATRAAVGGLQGASGDVQHAHHGVLRKLHLVVLCSGPHGHTVHIRLCSVSSGDGRSRCGRRRRNRRRRRRRRHGRVRCRHDGRCRDRGDRHRRCRDGRCRGGHQDEVVGRGSGVGHFVCLFAFVCFFSVLVL